MTNIATSFHPGDLNKDICWKRPQIYEGYFHTCSGKDLDKLIFFVKRKRVLDDRIICPT